jgi:hypothetical protein
MICLVVFASHFGCLFVTVGSTLSFLFVCLSFKFVCFCFLCPVCLFLCVFGFILRPLWIPCALRARPFPLAPSLSSTTRHALSGCAHAFSLALSLSSTARRALGYCSHAFSLSHHSLIYHALCALRTQLLVLVRSDVDHGHSSRRRRRVGALQQHGAGVPQSQKSD